MIRTITTADAPAAIGPYSQAVEGGSLLFLSGQIPLDPDTSEVVKDDIEDQTRQVFENIGNVLKAAGYNYADIVKTTVFLKDMGDFRKMNMVYAEFLAHKPARSTIEVSRLPRNVLVEIEAIAVK